MRPAKAISILTVPFAISCLVTLAGMCLTPFWDCRLEMPLTVDVWKPALFIFFVFSIVAAIVLYVDFLLIVKLLARVIAYRLVLLAVSGAIVAMLPRVALGA